MMCVYIFSFECNLVLCHPIHAPLFLYPLADVVPMLSGHNPNPPGPRKGYRQRQSRLVQPARANNPHSTLGAGRSGASRPGYRLTQQTQQTILPYPVSQ